MKHIEDNIAFYVGMLFLSLTILCSATRVARATDYYVSDFSQIQALMSSYSGGDVIYFKNDITDVSASVAALDGKPLTIDAQGYNYAYASGSSAFNAINNSKEITLKNWGSAANPVSGFYQTTTNPLAASVAGGVISGNNISILNSYFNGNGANGSSTVTYGGVISASGMVDILVSGSTLSGNTALMKGGAIYVYANMGGSLDIVNSDISNNSVLSYSEQTSYGGAIRAEALNKTSPLKVNLIGSSFSGNSISVARPIFGGVVGTSGYVSVLAENSSFVGNNISSNARAYGGVFTVSNTLTIVNSLFTDNSTATTIDDARGGAISYNGSSLKIIADGGNTIFANNTLTKYKGKSNEITVGNDLYAYGSPVYLNASAGNSVTFGSGISGVTGGSQNIYINRANTYNNSDGVAVAAPTTGAINLNADVNYMNLSLLGGSLAINSEGLPTDFDFSTSKLSLSGGILNLENSVIDNLSFSSLTANNAAGINFDTNLDTGQSDNITLGSITSGQNLKLNSINVLQDGNASSITLFKGGKSPVLSSSSANKRTITNLFKYDFSPSATIAGVLDILKTAIVGDTGLKTAVDDTNLVRTFSMISDETQSVDLGAMSGGSGASLIIFGNGKKISGGNNDGITIGTNQAILMSGVTDYYSFSSNTNGGAFNNAGTLSITGTNFNLNTSTGDGGTFYNSGTALIEDSLSVSNSAAVNGGAIYNAGSLTINGADDGTSSTAFAGNTASGLGGAVYNAGNLVFSTATGNISFSGNQANGSANDIYNTSAGVININGVGNSISFAGGISGSGTINKSSANTLLVSGDLSQYTGAFNQSLGTTTITDTFFNGLSSIYNGILNIGGTLSANSIIDLASTAVLNFTGSDAVTLASGTLTGSGNVNKTGTGNLYISGDYSGYNGIFTQTLGSTVVTNNLFNSLINIQGGNLELGTGSAFSANTVISLNAGANIVLSGSSNLDALFGQVFGAGDILKTGTGTVTLSGDFSGFSGGYTQTAGTTIIDLNNITLSNGTKQFNGGSLQTTGGILAQNVLLGSTATTQGQWTHFSDTGESITVDAAKLSFTGTGATATFGADASLAEGGTYLLADNIQNVANANTIAFEDSEVHLGSTDYTGNTTYSFTDAVLDLTSSANEDYQFSNLILNNTSLAIDLTFLNPTTINTDTITTATSSGYFTLGDIKILADADADINPIQTTVLNGVAFNTSVSALTITTTSHEYEVSTSGGDVIIKIAGTPLTLNEVNILTGNRAFNFSSGSTYNLLGALSPMGTGTFNVAGASNSASDSILSGALSGGGNGYFFNIASDNTAFTLKDLTVRDAVKTGDGAVLSLDNASSSALLNNLIVTNNEVTGNGGAVAQTAGVLTITSSSFNNNDASGNGGAVFLNTGRIAGTSFTGNSADYGGAIYVSAGGNVILQGPSSLTGNSALSAGGAIYNAGTLSIDSSGGNVTFSGNTVGTVSNDIATIGTLNLKGAANSISLNSVSGVGAINKSENNILNLNGDNRNYTGSFTQTGGTTNVNGNFFAGTNTISGGTLNWKTNDSTAYKMAISAGNLALFNNASLTIDATSSIAKAANLNIASGSTLNNLGSVVFSSGDVWSGTLNNSATVTMDGFIEVLDTDTVYNSLLPASNLILKNASELTFSGGSAVSPYQFSVGNLTIGDGTTGSVVTVLANNSLADTAVIALGTGNTLNIGLDETTNPGGNVSFNAGDTWGGTVVLVSGALNYANLTANGKLQAATGTMNINSGTLTLATDSFINVAVKSNIAAGATLAIAGGEMALTDSIDNWLGNLTMSSGIMYVDAFVDNIKFGAYQQTGGTLYIENGSDIIFNNVNDSITGGNVNIIDSSTLSVGSNSVFNPSIIDILSGGILKTNAGKSLELSGTLNVNNGTVDLRNGGVSLQTVNNMTVGSGGANFAIDIDGNTYDSFDISSLTAAEAGAVINIFEFTVLNNPTGNELSMNVFNASSLDDTLEFTATAQDVTGIYTLSSEGNGVYKLGLAPKPAPYLYESRVNAQNIGIIQNSIMTSVMQNFDNLYWFPSEGKNSGDEIRNRNVWVKVERFDDKAKFNNLKDVDTEYTLIMAGAKTDKIKLGSVDSSYGAYVGYIGGNQEYGNVKVNQNGGYLGAVAAFDKENWFFTAAANTGFLRAHANKTSGTDRYNNYWFGIGGKVGYNIPMDNSIVVQPSVYGAYTYISSEDYTSTTGARISSGELGLWEMAPTLKVSYLDDSLKVSVSGKYVFTADNGGEVRADTILLPNISINPYAEYGFEIFKEFDDWNMLANVNRRDGGREGWNVSLGMELPF